MLYLPSRRTVTDEESMPEDLVSRLLAEQRRRLIATILGAAEASDWWDKLSATEQRAHREKVLSSIGTFYDFCRDVVKVSGEDGLRNEHALELIRQVHEAQKVITHSLVGDRA